HHSQSLSLVSHHSLCSQEVAASRTRLERVEAAYRADKASQHDRLATLASDVRSAQAEVERARASSAASLQRSAKLVDSAQSEYELLLRRVESERELVHALI